MKLSRIISMACLLTQAHSTVIQRDINATLLSVTLSQPFINGPVRASIKNIGKASLKLFNVGNILDDGDTARTIELYHGIDVPTDGTVNLPESVFTILDPEQVVNVRVHPTELHQSSGDTGEYYEVTASGDIPVVDISSTALGGQSIPYQSNSLALKRTTRTAVRTRRTDNNDLRFSTDSECIPFSKTDVQNAATQAGNWAQTAKDASMDNSTLATVQFEKYFHTTQPYLRVVVSYRFEQIARACLDYANSDLDNWLSVYCATEDRPNCPPGVSGYPSTNTIILCPHWRDDLEASPTDCRRESRQSAIIALMARREKVFKPIADGTTTDYEGMMNLSTEGSMNNAYTYGLYAQALQGGC